MNEKTQNPELEAPTPEPNGAPRHKDERAGMLALIERMAFDPQVDV